MKLPKKPRQINLSTISQYCSSLFGLCGQILTTSFGARPKSDHYRVECESDCIRLVEGGLDVWAIRLCHIAVIAEVNLEADPILDDYFLVFVDWTCATYSVPITASGWTECVYFLNAHLNGMVSLRCAHVTERSSQVIWPPTLCGIALLLKKREELASAPQLSGDQVKTNLSPDVKNYINVHRPETWTS